MMSIWSDDVAVMVRPFRVYAELAAADDERPQRVAAARALFLLFVIGAFVSFITAGRLVPFHVASTMIFWVFLPVVQGLVLAAVARLFLPAPAPIWRALALYFTGHGPWLLFLTAIAGVCLFARDVYSTMIWLIRGGVLFGAALGIIAWSALLTFACFRAGLGASRARAGAATAVFYAGHVGVIVGYYLATNQIQPQLPWAP